MKIIRKTKIVECKDISLYFEFKNMPGAGFAFPCDEQGNVDTKNLPPEALGNYKKCLSGEHDVICKGVRILRWNVREPAVGLCECGKEVELSHFTNTCECGADYNFAGQRLAPREQWGEETGEHWTECY